MLAIYSRRKSARTKGQNLGHEEQDWIRRAVAGDAAAMRSLLERYGPQVWGEIRGRIGRKFQSLIDADDVMQVTYLEAFLQAEFITATDPTGFLAWIRRIAENNLRDAIKELERKKRPGPSRRIENTVDTEESCVALIELLGVDSATPSRVAARGEASGIVQRALDQLPSDYASAVRLYDLEGREIAEVAREMGRSAGAVHMLRARAHDRLRTLLGRPHQFFSEA